MKMTLIVVATGLAGVLAGAAAASYREAEQPAVSPVTTGAAPSRQAGSSPRVILPSPFRQAATTTATAEAPRANWPPADGAVEYNKAMVALLTLASTPKATTREPAQATVANEAVASVAQQSAAQAGVRAQTRQRARRAPQADNDMIVVRDVNGRRIRIKRANIPQISGYRARVYASSPYRRYGPPPGYR
ncbi:MAG: hypothetical protein ACRECO_11340 [Xanthobacteraceae bacterium]